MSAASRLLLVGLLLGGCRTSAPVSGSPARAGNTVEVRVGPGESLTDALLQAHGERVRRVAYVPPRFAAGMARVDSTVLGGNAGTAYQYAVDGALLNVYVYGLPGATVDSQVASTLESLAELKRLGRIESFEQTGQATLPVTWKGAEATLHRTDLVEVIGGQTHRSEMFLLEDGPAWIKIRLTYPEGRFARADTDALARALLGDER